MTNDGARSTEPGVALDPPATDPPAKPPLWTRDFTLNALGTVGLFGSFFYLLSVLPEYVDSIGGEKWQIGVIVGGFGIVPMLLRPFVGRWSDRGHRKRLQRIGLLTMAVATALMVLSEDVISLFLLRTGQGIGMALFPTAAASLAAELAPPARRGEGLGYYGMATSCAQMVTPALGVWIAHVWGFDAVFLIAASTSLVTLLVVQPIREPASEARAGDGSALIARRAIFPDADLPLGHVLLRRVLRLPAAARQRPWARQRRAVLPRLRRGRDREPPGRRSDLRSARARADCRARPAPDVRRHVAARRRAVAADALGRRGADRHRPRRLAHRPALARRRPRTGQREGARGGGAAAGVGHRRTQRRHDPRRRRDAAGSRLGLLDVGRDSCSPRPSRCSSLRRAACWR